MEKKVEQNNQSKTRIQKLSKKVPAFFFTMYFSPVFVDLVVMGYLKVFDFRDIGKIILTPIFILGICLVTAISCTLYFIQTSPSDIKSSHNLCFRR